MTRKLTVRNETEAEAVRQLERDIEAIADKMPSWLWDACGLSYVYEDVDEALCAYDRVGVTETELRALYGDR